MTQEMWRPVVGFEDAYEVSELGRVRSVARVVPCRHGQNRRVPSRLRSVTTSSRYPSVGLSRNGVRSTRRIHQLVAAAFLGAAPAGQEVLHSNGDATDCRLVNLRYGTHRENGADMVRHGRTRHTGTCVRGHRLQTPNLTTRGRCRACDRMSSRRTYARKMEREFDADRVADRYYQELMAGGPA